MAASFVPSPDPNTAMFTQPNTERSHSVVQQTQTEVPNHLHWNPNGPSPTTELQRDINETISASVRMSTRARLTCAEEQRAYILSQLQSVSQDIASILENIEQEKAGRGTSQEGVLEALEQRLGDS